MHQKTFYGIMITTMNNGQMHTNNEISMTAKRIELYISFGCPVQITTLRVSLFFIGVFTVFRRYILELKVISGMDSAYIQTRTFK